MLRSLHGWHPAATWGMCLLAEHRKCCLPPTLRSSSAPRMCAWARRFSGTVEGRRWGKARAYQRRPCESRGPYAAADGRGTFGRRFGSAFHSGCWTTQSVSHRASSMDHAVWVPAFALGHAHIWCDGLTRASLRDSRIGDLCDFSSGTSAVAEVSGCCHISIGHWAGSGIVASIKGGGACRMHGRGQRCLPATAFEG